MFASSSHQRFLLLVPDSPCARLSYLAHNGRSDETPTWTACPVPSRHTTTDESSPSGSPATRRTTTPRAPTSYPYSGSTSSTLDPVGCNDTARFFPIPVLAIGRCSSQNLSEGKRWTRGLRGIPTIWPRRAGGWLETPCISQTKTGASSSRGLMPRWHGCAQTHTDSSRSPTRKRTQSTSRERRDDRVQARGRSAAEQLTPKRKTVGLRQRSSSTRSKSDEARIGVPSGNVTFTIQIKILLWLATESETLPRGRLSYANTFVYKRPPRRPAGARSGARDGSGCAGPGAAAGVASKDPGLNRG